MKKPPLHFIHRLDSHNIVATFDGRPHHSPASPRGEPLRQRRLYALRPLARGKPPGDYFCYTTLRRSTTDFAVGRVASKLCAACSSVARTLLGKNLLAMGNLVRQSTGETTQRGQASSALRYELRYRFQPAPPGFANHYLPTPSTEIPKLPLLPLFPKGGKDNHGSKIAWSMTSNQGRELSSSRRVGCG